MPGGRLEMDTNCWLEDLKVRYHFGNLDVDGRIILKLVCKNCNVDLIELDEDGVFKMVLTSSMASTVASESLQ
jgi:hypothetical protein